MKTALNVILAVSIAVLLNSIILTHILGLEQRPPLIIATAAGVAVMMSRKAEAQRKKKEEEAESSV